MWNLVESNKLISSESKVINHRKHLRKVASVRPSIDNKAPWRPNYSISKRKNKYESLKMSSIDVENHSLLNRILKIQYGETKNPINATPTCYSSHPKLVGVVKENERERYRQEINRENRKILEKIEGAHSTYGKNTWGPQWKQMRTYRNNLVRKEVVAADLSLLVRTIDNQSVASRPHSALLAKTTYE